MSSESDELKVEINANFLLVTANVGTLFEDPEGIQPVWLDEFSQVVENQKPTFVALHCQEIGGKDYKSSMEPVKAFFKKLQDCEFMKEFVTVRGYMDGDYNFVDQYTALGCFYFVHESIKDNTLQYNYTSEQFDEISGKEMNWKEVAKLPHILKEKFEQDFFPDCKWSRKGYSRVRWKIHEKVVEFVNIHLFHDDNNLVSIDQSPSMYTANRKRALKFVVQRLKEQHVVNNGTFFVFGDFNFRLDLKKLVKTLCPDSQKQVVRAQEGDELIRVVYRNGGKRASRFRRSAKKSAENGTEEFVVKLEKKLFQVDKSVLKKHPDYEHLQQFDRELTLMKSQLREFPITFAPTYPYSENTSDNDHYMDTRCPSWCDRILASSDTWCWIQSQKNKGDSTYTTMGKTVCMGDHKPVYLSFTADVNENNNGSMNGKRASRNGKTSTAL